MGQSQSDRFAAVRRGEAWAEREVSQLIQRFARHACSRVGTALQVELGWEDVAQEASRRFFATGIHQYGGTGSEESYLYTVVKSTLIQIARSANRRKKREDVAAETETVTHSNSQHRLDVELILNRLDEVCRDLLKRAFLEEVPYATLARDLELAESSVRAKVSRCVRRAREFSSQ